MPVLARLYQELRQFEKVVHHLLLQAWLVKRRCRVIHRDDQALSRTTWLSMNVRNPRFREPSRHAVSPQRDDYFWINHLDLAVKVFSAGRNFGRFRVTVTRRT